MPVGGTGLRGVCAALALAVPGGGLAAQGGPLVLPSGVTATHHETIWDEDGSLIRLRYIVPRLAEPGSLYAGDALRIFEDMLWLCETQLVGADMDGATLREQGWDGVVISLMDRPLEFGVRDPDVFQVFELFSLTMDGCDLDLDDYHD